MTHTASSQHTDSEPNRNVEGMRMALMLPYRVTPAVEADAFATVYKNNPRYVNGVSESLFKQGICLPSGPCVADGDVAYIVDTIKACIEK